MFGESVLYVFVPAITSASEATRPRSVFGATASSEIVPAFTSACVAKVTLPPPPVAVAAIVIRPSLPVVSVMFDPCTRSVFSRKPWSLRLS